MSSMWGSLDDLLHALQDTAATVSAKQQELLVAERSMQEDRSALEAQRIELEEQRRQLAADRGEVDRLRRELEDEKLSMQKLRAGPNDLIGLNFGGERIVTVKRSLLLQFEGSFLACMFSGRHEDSMDKDREGNIFFDYSPTVMMPLIDYLRLHRDKAPDEELPPPKLSPEDERAWHAMLDFMGLRHVVTPPTVFEGIRTDVSLRSLCGWTMFFCEPWSHQTTMDDFVPPPHLRGNVLLVGARNPGDDGLVVAAMGAAEVVTSVTQREEYRFHNGAYWYACEGRAVGFAPEADALKNYNFYDGHGVQPELRLSWPLATTTCGGRAGKFTFDVLHKYEKVILVAKASL